MIILLILGVCTLKDFSKAGIIMSRPRSLRALTYLMMSIPLVVMEEGKMKALQLTELPLKLSVNLDNLRLPVKQTGCHTYPDFHIWLHWIA